MISPLTENEVVDALVKHFSDRGFAIEGQCSTLETGVDVVAWDSRAGVRWRVEAKGGTSSKPGTARYGKPFTRNQVKTHVSVAFFTQQSYGRPSPNDGSSRHRLSG